MSDVGDSIPAASGASITEFCCLQPINPHMKKITDRLETFHLSQNWPSERIQAKPLEIADAGFYYLGDKDRVRCWYCNGGLQNLERYDLPRQEHAKWFPKCEFLLKSKGLKFVEDVIKQFPKLNQPNITNPASLEIVLVYKIIPMFTRIF